MRAALGPFRWLRAHALAADALLGAAFAALGVAGLWLVPDDLRAGEGAVEPDALAVVLVLATTVPLAWRRRRPLWCLTVVGVAAIALSALRYPDAIDGLTVVVALYSVAAHAARADAVVAAAITAVGVAIAVSTTPGQLTFAHFASNYLIFGTAWILGDNLRTRRAYVSGLEERAESLERARVEEARAAVASERIRIARELHDVVAHSMSVMVIQAGAARRVLARDHDAAVQALTAVEQVGRQALDEMRRSLGMLRDGAAPVFDTAPQPTVDDIAELVTHTAEAGLAVDLTVEGDPRPLPPGIGLSAYRIVQEALTNALRHAGPAHAVVRIRYCPDHLELEVRDDGRGAAAALDADDGPGHGLVGMRERVQLFGGELKVGHPAGGGFQVRARIPLGPSR